MHLSWILQVFVITVKAGIVLTLVVFWVSRYVPLADQVAVVNAAQKILTPGP